MELSVYIDKYILIYCLFLAFVIGAVFGSFLNCAAYRIAHHESFMKGRSHCPNCGHVLGVIDLIPLLGWLLRKGKCAYCGEKISVRYPLTELFFALQAVFCLLKFDLTPLCLRNFIFACCLFTLSLVDLEIMEIPDGALLTAVGAWVLYLPIANMDMRKIAGNVLCGLVYGAVLLFLSLLLDKLLGKESLGGGDIKLFAVIGLYLGWISTLFAVLLSCIFGLLIVFLFLRRKDEGHAPFPFGPSIAAAAWCMMLIGDPLVNWYLGLIGM